ncbi:MAG: UTP--glucose-1-phosphate uridylyltransferase [Akkermansiaceae bacterium]|nr:UTP--glucose-1-phosphate uridylyltransferase [Akkermansiaceae bacterium]
MSSFEAIEKKMRGVGLSDAAIGAFRHSVNVLESKQSMMIPESDIEPAEGVAEWETLVAATPEADAALLAQSVMIKLNGGLGTGMGLQKAKSLLEIKPGVTFLDVIVRQVRHLRERAGYPVSLLLMNSFSTGADTMAHLAQYAAEGFADSQQVEMIQNRVPKLLTDTLEPVQFPANPDLEWCPPGHGDIYPALVGSGWLDKLLAAGVKYAFVSNSDNLGAQPDTRFLRWFAESGVPFVMEVTRRTEADKKGGHLATRKTDGQPLLREIAQCPDADVADFQDINKHRYFNTNNLWIRLDVLKDLLNANDGVLPLPVIRNTKTVDPRDAATPQVYQLETAMGAAIQCFPGAKAVCVPRTRFFPVKTCSDLLLLRSDAVEITDTGLMALAPECKGVAPIVQLDSKLYKLVDSLDALGVPSLKHVSKLTVTGPHHFADGEPLSGEVSV